MAERLLFGKPTTFQEAILRLPPDNHPRMGKDESITRLYAFKTALSEISNSDHHNLENRMIPLTRNDLALLERVSFKRGVVEITVSWTTAGGTWALIYGNTNSDYRHFEVARMDPPYPDPNFILVCIQTNSSFTKNPESIEYDVGLITPPELKSLKNSLLHVSSLPSVS